MKKGLKRVLAFVFALAMIIVMIPTSEVKAAEYPPSKMTVMVSTTDGVYCLCNSNVGKSTRIKNIKIADRSVLSFAGVDYTSWQDEKGKTKYDANLFIRALKPGKTKISYKVGSRTRTITVTVKAYKNLLKSVKMFGISEDGSTELAAATTNAAGAVFDYPEKSNNKIQFQAASGYVVIGYQLMDLQWNLISEYWPERPTSKLSKKAKLPDSDGAMMIVTVMDRNGTCTEFKYYFLK